MLQRYDVFISHAGEDKKPLAILIYECLKRRGIRAFLDQEELLVGGNAVNEMDIAMQTALVGLFILSPEFALKPYPMRELICFQRRAGVYGESSHGSSGVRPVLIPVFYRLTVAESKYAAEFEKAHCDQTVRNRFDERMKRGETSLASVLKALTLLVENTGVENVDGVTSADTEDMARGRRVLAERIVDEVIRVLVRRSDELKLSEQRGSTIGRSSNESHATFNVPKNPKEVVLNFSGTQEGDPGQTYEAQVLREVLRRDEVIKIVGIIGTGGVGKSCILRGIGRYAEIRYHFPGGVYYVSLGMDGSVSELRSELMRLLKASGGKRVAEELRDETHMGVILEELGKLMGKGRSLLLVDDVWNRNDMKAGIVSKLSSVFSEEYGGVVVVATRFDSVALRCDATVYVRPREAISEVSKAILLNYSKFSAEEVEDAGLQIVVDQLLMLGGGLPVWLAVIGRGVRKVGLKLQGGRLGAWETYLEKVSVTVRNDEDYLLQEGIGEYKGLKSTLLVALQILENDEITKVVGLTYSWREMYRSLCVMKKQMVMPVSVLQRMWKLGSAGVVWKVLEGFVNVGLGEIVYEGREGVKGFRIHDFLHTFACFLATVAGEVKAWHRILLDGYLDVRADGKARAWWSVSDDGYIHENVCRHLVRSGCTRELVMLLLRVEWTLLRHKVGGRWRWIRDFAECLQAMCSSLEYEEWTDEWRMGLILVRDAAVECWKYVRESPAELGYQVFGRLQNSGEGVVRRYLQSVVAWHPKPWVRPVAQILPRPGTMGLGGELSVNGFVTDVLLHSDPLFAVVGAGREIIIADMREMRVTKRLLLTDFVKKVCLRDDGVHVLSLSACDEMQEWNIVTGENVRSVTLDGSGAGDYHFATHSLCATFSGDGHFLVTGYGDGTVVRWDAQTGKIVGDVIQCYDGPVGCVAVSPDGSCIVVDGIKDNLKFYSVSTEAQEESVMTCDKLRTEVSCVAFGSDGRRVVSGSKDGTICLWNAETKAQIGDPIRGHKALVACVTFSSDCKQIVSSSWDNFVRVWDCARGEQVGPTPLRQFRTTSVSCVAVSGSGRFVVSGGVQGSVRVWDLEAASDVSEEPHGVDDAVIHLTGSPNGKFFVSGALDGTVKIWDVLTGVQKGEALRGHSEAVFCVAVSPDSQRIVSGSLDNAIRVWDVSSHSQVGEPICAHADAVSCVTYSPDGQFFVSGSHDGTVRIWRADNHAQLGEPIFDGAGEKSERRRQIESVVVSPDGRRILWAQGNGAIRLWDVRARRAVGKPRVMGDERIRRRLEFVGEREVRSLDMVYEDEVRWRLDVKKGLVRLTEGQVAWNQVVCRDRFVQCARGGVTLATLPFRLAFIDCWHFDSLRGVLGVGRGDGRVFVFHLET